MNSIQNRLPSLKGVRFYISEPFEDYIQQIAEIPDNYYRGSTLQSGRNLIKKLEMHQINGEPIEIVVKAFAKPGNIKGYMYANFVQTKAKRSIQNAQYLMELGILTPEPIACIEHLKCQSLQDSFYVCRFWDHNFDLGSLLYQGEFSDVNTQLLLEQLSQFTAVQHNKGIFHLDYNPGNILVRVNEGHFTFALIDLNRVRITKMGIQDRIMGLVRLTLKPEIMREIGSFYAKYIGVDLNEFCTRLETEHRRFWAGRIRIERIKGFLLNGSAKI